jgi:hypothetical protein
VGASQGLLTQRTLPAPSSSLKPTTPSSNLPPPEKRTTQNWSVKRSKLVALQKNQVSVQDPSHSPGVQ